MLTTFNEVDMTAVMALRERRKEAFKKQHGVGLGIASFFVKASVAALRAFPQLNAEIQGDEIVLKHYYDIGMAVGAEGGLVVPVLRDADRMSFAQIEQAIRDFAQKRAGRHADARGSRAAARSRSPTAACSDRCSARRSSIRRRSASSACTRSRIAPIAVERPGRRSGR